MHRVQIKCTSNTKYYKTVTVTLWLCNQWTVLSFVKSTGLHCCTYSACKKNLKEYTFAIDKTYKYYPYVTNAIIYKIQDMFIYNK